MALGVVRDLREHRAPPGEEDLAAFETDVLAGFVLARASAGLTDSTIRNDANHLELIRDWFGRPLWEMQPEDGDVYFGKVLREAKPVASTTARTIKLSAAIRAGSAFSPAAWTRSTVCTRHPPAPPPAALAPTPLPWRESAPPLPRDKTACLASCICTMPNTSRPESHGACSPMPPP
ncbi:hypothetical protein [Nonomuraea basaltis]|uniref:hypothetical protein n=1 Tax=Nonomuraea basaltis TaxID=2495887 RepID=UPI0019815671|nr:hypothetical protein [Nonomuraea basaltis]